MHHSEGVNTDTKRQIRHVFFYMQIISFKPLIGMLQSIYPQRIGIEYRMGRRDGPLKKGKIDI